MTCGSQGPNKSFSARGDGLEKVLMTFIGRNIIGSGSCPQPFAENRSIPAQLNQLDELRSEGHIFQVGKVPGVV